MIGSEGMVVVIKMVVMVNEVMMLTIVIVELALLTHRLLLRYSDPWSNPEHSLDRSLVNGRDSKYESTNKAISK